MTFNDPFDVQSGLHLNFNIDTLPAKIIQRLGEFAATATPPTVDPKDVWGQLVLKVRDLYPAHGFPSERWAEGASARLGSLANEIRMTQAKYQSHWRNEVLPGVRIFCVSEHRDNLLMWAHYGREHTGAVFEFWSLPDEDNPLSVARPVRYVSEPPSFFSESELLDDIFSFRKLDFQRLYRNYVFAKSVHWQYEHEWRVWYPLSKSGTYDDMPIRRSEFGALYLGCRVKPDFKAEVLAILHQAFPDVQPFHAVKLEGAYALAFTEV